RRDALGRAGLPGADRPPRGLRRAGPRVGRPRVLPLARLAGPRRGALRMSTTLGPLDLAVLGTYLALVLGVSIAIARRQKTGEDYFLAGRGFGGFTLALSILANQASAVSLVGAPAFVALRE